MKTTFDRLIRFRDSTGRVLYGEAPVEEQLVGLQARVYAGQVPWNLEATEQMADIVEVLSPLHSTPIVYGVGLNYKTHVTETGHPMPPFPTIFNKPSSTLNGPYSDIMISPECPNIDYEGELTVIIGRDVKDVKAEDVEDYILGYTVGNDVSSRYWQIPERSGHQHGYAKSFDGFAPIGPVIVSSMVADPKTMTLTTRVNGEERQRSGVDDLLFAVSDIIAHLSRATTLSAGTVIMTGTPGGVAASMTPPAWLKNGDVVEVSISGIGTIRNRFVFLSEEA